MTLSPLYAILDCETLQRQGRGAAGVACELRDAGVTLMQYRDKVNGPQKVLQACAEVAEVFRGVEASLILNDRADLAALAGWGCHVGQGDLGVADALRLTSVVGVSTHTLGQVGAADATGAAYIAVGPVFTTSTKADAEAVVGLDFVRQARAVTSKPLVAIGGIALENCCSVVEAGADSVAVISGLFVPGRTVREVAEDFLARLR